ncbi:MAG TPA: LysR family transcriptional regulator [Burkholderiales bacterium]
MDLNLLRVFDAVYRERNLTRAGEVLFLSQPAVSHALARLRRQIGDPLFIREGQGVVPTPLAERLAPDIRAALALLQQAVQRRDFVPARDLARVVIAMHDEIEPAVLPRVYARLTAKAAPGLHIASVRLNRPNLVTDLASRRVDLAIDVARAIESDLHHAPLLRDDFCVVSRTRRRLDARAYLAASHIAVSSRPTGLAVEDILLSRLGFERQVRLRCQQYEAACRIVAASDLLLTMPRRHAEAVNATIGNALLPVPLPLPAIELHLYWHRQAEDEPGNRWLRGELLALSEGLTGRAKKAKR